MPKKYLITALTIVSLFTFLKLATPAQALPTLLPSEGYAEGDYQLADFVSLALNATNIILAVAASLALLAFVIGGVMFLVSSGKSELVTRGKTTLLGGVIGLFIVFFSWSIVDFTLDKLGYDKSTFGPWYQRPGRVAVTKKPVTGTSAATGQPGQSTTPQTQKAWGYDSLSIKNQLQDASKDITDLLDCMSQNGSTASYGNISSISDSNYIGNPSGCDKKPCPSNCQHSCGSCHYGGGGGSNKSFAIDFGNENDWTAISTVAQKCSQYIKDIRLEDKNGNKVCTTGEATHIHIATVGCPKNDVANKVCP